MSKQVERTTVVRMSKSLHERIKALAASRGMKLHALADIMAKVWLSLPEHKAFPKNPTK